MIGYNLFAFNIVSVGALFLQLRQNDLLYIPLPGKLN